jgi:hypothetical protein
VSLVAAVSDRSKDTCKDTARRMQTTRLRRTLYRLVHEFGQLVGALLAPAVLLLWLLDVLEVAAQRTLLKRDLRYPRLRDGVQVEWNGSSSEETHA